MCLCRKTACRTFEAHGTVNRTTNETVIMSKQTTIIRNLLVLMAFFAAALMSPPEAKVKKIGASLPIRPVAIRNVAYNHNGTIFAIPNFVSAGSVALFWVNEQGAIASVPSRLSEANFVRSKGLFFLRKKADADPSMAFVNLPELLSGYSVAFSENNGALAITGGDRVVVYSGDENWEIIKTLNIGTAATRSVFSPDGSKLVIISDGKAYLFETATYALAATIEPESSSKFLDAAFSHDSKKCALFESRGSLNDYTSRIRIFDLPLKVIERDLPWFMLHTASEPGKHLPLVSFGPADTLLAVTLPATFTGKVLLIKSNDGAIVKEMKGFAHAFSPDGTLFAGNNTIFKTATWSELGKIPQSTVACTFSPTERVIITVTQDAISRYRIED